ncbi:phenylalanine--tRNA ligase beta subunit-related protein [Streptomyces sp. NPDC020403]|uniref:B3/B4 domain-containing protein n=1 Tax=unclassified Streptomyces TaxID=2593676 RepID=UPI0033CB7972
MTIFRINAAVVEAFPDTLIAVVTATALRGREPWPATTTAQRELEQQLAGGTWQPADETDPRIEAWHTAYRSFGTNPRRVRPSVDALGRRLAKKGTLPRINPAVDSYNVVSVRHGVPIGAFDLDRITGDVEIRCADGSEAFTPLGEPDAIEHPRAGEIICTDSTDVLTRHWNHRDAHRTRVTEDSTHVAFVLETLRGTADGHLLKAAVGELQGLLEGHSAQSTVHYLDPSHPQATIS